METVINEILPFVCQYGILAGFGLATVFNLLARGINGALAIFRI